MNTDMHTLFWYIRSELVLLRRRSNATFAEKTKPFSAQKRFCVGVSDTETIARNGVDEIVVGIIHTLDDILSAEAILWNLLFLVHIVQSLSVHKCSLTKYEELATTEGYSLVPLDLNFTRIHCYLEIIMDVCRANLVMLCTKDTLHSQKNEGSNTNASLPIRIPYSNGSSNVSPIQPPAHKSPKGLKYTRGNIDLHGYAGNVTAVKRTNSDQELSTKFINDKIDVQNRLCSKLDSKDLLNAHAHATDAMLNSVTDDGTGLPTYETRLSTRAKESMSKTPHSILRWRAAQHTIQMAVRIPKCARANKVHAARIETR
jgi:hypothetical protein